MLSYENAAVVADSKFDFHAYKEDGSTDGKWLKDESGTVVYAKYFTPLPSYDKKADKLFAFVEFVTSSLYRRLLGESRTPIVFLLTSTRLPAIASVRLENLQTFNSFEKLENLPNVSGDIGFEEYAAVSIFLGNFDWYNTGNFGLKNGKIAAIDFGFTFTLKFSNATTFLSYIALLITRYHHSANIEKAILALNQLEFNLHRFIESIERVLTTPNEELLAKMGRDIDSFVKGCNFDWDVAEEHCIPLDPTVNKLTEPCLNPNIKEPKDFAQFANNYLAEQRKLFAEALEQLRIIARFDKPPEYFNLEWLSPYSKKVNNRLRVIEPLAYAAIRNIKIKEDSGEQLDALDYAQKHELKVFGSSNPLHGFLSFCHAWRFDTATFMFGGTRKVPQNDRPKNYLLLDKYERYALMCGTSLCTTPKYEPFAQIILFKLEEIANTCRLEVKKNTGNAEKQNQAYYDENTAIVKLGEWLKEYRNTYSIDIYLLLFIAYSRVVFAHHWNATEVTPYFARVMRTVAEEPSNESNVLPSLFVDSRFIERLKQHCQNIEKETVNYANASRILQFVGFKFTIGLIRNHLSLYSSLTTKTQTCIQLLSLIGNFVFEGFQFPCGMPRIKREVAVLKEKPIIVFPENFQENIAKVFSSDKCIVQIIEPF